jgi:hypothetical protein
MLYLTQPSRMDPMQVASIIVKADWDSDAAVWVATSTDISGLAVEASSLETLQTKVMAAVADLIELNGSPSQLPEIPVHIMSSHVAMVANPHS